MKGWPLRVFFWSLWNYILIIGDITWKRHWLWFQSSIGLFSVDNPAPEETIWLLHLIMITCTVLGLSTMLKRAYFALFLGKKKYGKLLKFDMNDEECLQAFYTYDVYRFHSFLCNQRNV
jgi:hypothetical protein